MWFDESVVYQIYPLGAFGAPFENDHVPAHRILKAESWLPHLEKIGVNAVLFNPLFESVSHGYNTTDMRKVDDRLGTEEDLARVCQAYQTAGIRVLFDAVFNHVGREFFAFQDVLKNRENSRYKDWFTIDFGGDTSFHDGFWYKNWEGYDELVSLNLKNPEVVQYLLDTVDWWRHAFGISGLRLDVAYCLDQDFLRQLHDHVKQYDGEPFFLLGETLHGDYNTWVNDVMLDSCTNYECYKGIHSSFNSRNFFEILYSFNRQFGKEPWCLYTGKNLLSFVDNHDVTRIASILEKKEQLPLVYGMLFTMPGIPAIYYGSESGVEGVKSGNDTGIRPEIEQPDWNELTDLIARLTEIRRSEPALAYGDYTQIALTNTACVYQRSHDGDTIWYAVNIDDNPMTMQVNRDVQAEDLLSGEKLEIHGSLDLQPGQMRILKLQAA
ncbi:alpha-amylase family glycosyl hydrolase [uncultured Faecalibaculum sp.]|uniref:alpha-amylase family glycosyl hydrolase n=1 Tax=uncultured Faecalibaculum sp. TaxID=1729681 RepID=UPI002611B365|nr:alpha-amylase family glycosyl hydrolase [uncultured Faecalibaculum sp.]